MILFIDNHRYRFSIEFAFMTLPPIVRLVQNPVAIARQRIAGLIRVIHAMRCGKICKLHAENYMVYGVHITGHALRRQEINFGREQTTR